MLKTNLMLVSNCLGQVAFIVSDEVVEVLVPANPSPVWMEFVKFSRHFKLLLRAQ